MPTTTLPPWLAAVRQAQATSTCVTLPEQPLAGQGRALYLAPHPDDAEAVGVTVRALAQGGWDLHWLVLTSGWSGVQDSFAGPDRRAKGDTRAVEQRRAATYFGLPPAALTLANLPEDGAGELEDSPATYAAFAALLTAAAPDLVLLPHGEDSNLTHRRTYQWLLTWGHAQRQPPQVLAAEDPKTLRFLPHLQVVFGPASQAWKRTLLDCHRSQATRNLLTRGHTLGDRILAVNLAVPALPPGTAAERFALCCAPAR